MIFFLQEDDKIIDLVNKYGLTKWSHCNVFLLIVLSLYGLLKCIFPLCANTLVTILCWCIAGQLPELPTADPGMFPNMLPNMFNLSALGQVTTVLLLWFSVASTQIMDSPFFRHNATRFTLICSLFGDGRINPPVIYHASFFHLLCSHCHDTAGMLDFLFCAWDFSCSVMHMSDHSFLRLLGMLGVFTSVDFLQSLMNR